jgi:4-amino-4-deoxy-L-arabinose transferase-like glycosyltransferase
MKHGRFPMVIVLLVAAVLRLVDLGGVPPGLEHDEVANWLIDRDVLAGKHGLYFEKAYGHEAGYHYLQAAAVALFGDHVYGLRLPSVFAGLLGIAMSYALTRKLLGETAALVSGALLAGLFWQLFLSRLGVRAILLPAVSGLSAWFFWKGLQAEPGKPALRDLLAAGGLSGASLYTYMAARAVPLIFAAFAAYLALFQRDLFRRHWRGLAIFFAMLIAVAAPLAAWLLAHPGAEYRIGEIDQPLAALRAGDVGPVAENGLRLLGFFGWAGDPLVRQNLPGRPVFDPLTGLCFYVGVLLALWRWRRPEYAFVVLWLVISLVPSLVTADAPSSIRCVNALVVVGGLAGLSLELGLRMAGSGRLAAAGVAVWLVLAAGWTAWDYFGRWTQLDEVHFVWQTALWEAAGALDADPNPGPVVVAGWTPDTMDPPTMELFLRRDDLSLRYVDPAEALLFPSQGARMVRPSILPVDPLLSELADGWGWATKDRGSYTLTYLPAPEPAETAPPIWFDNGVAFLGIQVHHAPGGVAILSLWQARGPVQEPLRIFCHLLGDGGEIAAQDDGLGAPPGHWGSGDLIVQVHRISPPPGVYQPRIGLYNPQTGDRWGHDSEGGLTDALSLDSIVVP